MSQADVLDLFNCLVLDDNQWDYKVKGGNFHTNYIEFGLVLDFFPDGHQINVLKERFEPLDVRTLFTRAERYSTSCTAPQS